MPTKHPISAPKPQTISKASKVFNTKPANYNNRENAIKKILKQSLILSDFRLNFSQQTSESFIYYQVPRISRKTVFLCLLNNWSK
jgi:hypothetical protein